jgi:hypothetical protein
MTVKTLPGLRAVTRNPRSGAEDRGARIPELNPSDPTDPFANWIAEAVASGSQTLADHALVDQQHHRDAGEQNTVIVI